jgi:CheY-like chemotaxis protein/anti-sigma regulatory factor (Ser/Thr protein kinase)
VVWNLANNAIKFTPKGGTVEVRLERSGTDMALTVRDTGKGIDGAFLPYVFERFRQAEGSTTRRSGGLGLGLSLVRYLVEAHGGTVRAESDGDGCGATFTVTLPVQAAIPDAVALDRPDATASRDDVGSPFDRESLRGVTVLVVDDEADARDLVATVLRGSGAEVTTASSAERGLELLIQSPPAVLLSDIGMPNTDGYELIRRVRALAETRGAQTPAVALTAYAREQDRRRALEAGFQRHVAKPVEPSELVRIVTSLVHR